MSMCIAPNGQVRLTEPFLGRAYDAPSHSATIGASRTHKMGKLSHLGTDEVRGVHLVGYAHTKMDLIQEAYSRLFPEKTFDYATELNYNLRLSDFNANVRFNQRKITLNLNLQWKDIDDEIKIGLVQSLLLKVFKTKKNTPNIELYNNFVRNIPILTPKLQSDPLLQDSFNRVNAQFFDNLLEQTNLYWGSDSRRKLASYNFHEDAISVSTLFKTVAPKVLDYIMYHEMLHKWQKFTHKNGRNSFHGREFREAERQYPEQEQIEREISYLVKNKTTKKSWFNWF